MNKKVKNLLKGLNCVSDVWSSVMPTRLMGWKLDCFQSVFNKLSPSVVAPRVLSTKQHVSSAAFSSFCYRFIMGCRTRGMTCSHKISPAAEIKQSWWEWRWDESKNRRAFRGLGFHALSAFMFTFMWNHAAAVRRLPVEKSCKFFPCLSLKH